VGQLANGGVGEGPGLRRGDRRDPDEPERQCLYRLHHDGGDIRGIQLKLVEQLRIEQLQFFQFQRIEQFQPFQLERIIEQQFQLLGQLFERGALYGLRLDGKAA